VARQVFPATQAQFLTVLASSTLVSMAVQKIQACKFSHITFMDGWLKACQYHPHIAPICLTWYVESLPRWEAAFSATLQSFKKKRVKKKINYFSFLSPKNIIINSYFYRLIGKLTAFLQLQEFSLRNAPVDYTTSSTRRSRPP
jgi:hypothetical protein